MSFSSFDQLNEKETNFVIDLYLIMHGHTYTYMLAYMHGQLDLPHIPYIKIVSTHSSCDLTSSLLINLSRSRSRLIRMIHACKL